jgi:hypothetical protein
LTRTGIDGACHRARIRATRWLENSLSALRDLSGHISGINALDRPPAFVQCKIADCILADWLYFTVNSEIQHPGAASRMTPILPFAISRSGSGLKAS